MDLPTAVLVGAVILSLPWWIRAGIATYELVEDTFEERMEKFKEAIEHGAEVLGTKRPTIRFDEDREGTHPFGGR